MEVSTFVGLGDDEVTEAVLVGLITSESLEEHTGEVLGLPVFLEVLAVLVVNQPEGHVFTSEVFIEVWLPVGTAGPVEVLVVSLPGVEVHLVGVLDGFLFFLLWFVVHWFILLGFFLLIFLGWFFNLEGLWNEVLFSELELTEELGDNWELSSDHVHVSEDVLVLGLVSDKFDVPLEDGDKVEVGDGDAVSDGESVLRHELLETVKLVESLGVEVLGKAWVEEGSTFGRADVVKEAGIVSHVLSPFDHGVDLSDLSELTAEIAWALSLQTDISDDGWHVVNSDVTINKGDGTTLSLFSSFTFETEDFDEELNDFSVAFAGGNNLHVIKEVKWLSFAILYFVIMQNYSNIII